MSGRVRWYRDGKLVVGHRKTDRRQSPRRTDRDLPLWRVSFVLPDSLGLTAGPVHGLVGANIVIIGRDALGLVIGRNRDWALAQAQALADSLGHHRRPLMVRVVRGEDTVLSAVGYDRGEAGVVEIGRRGITEGCRHVQR